jgi:hypothetical protein
MPRTGSVSLNIVELSGELHRAETDAGEFRTCFIRVAICRLSLFVAI